VNNLKLIALSLIVGGCTTTSIKSKWMDLRSAASVDCKEWPVNTAVIEISDINVLGSEPYGFFSQQKLRTGAPAVFWHGFSDPDLFKSDHVERRDYGRGSKVLGVFSLARQPHVVLSQRHKDKSFLEIRRITGDYKQVFKSQLFDFEILDGEVLKTEQTVWVALNPDSSKRHIYGASFKDGKWEGTLSKKANLRSGDDVKFVSLGSDRLGVVAFSQKSTGKDGKLGFEFQLVLPGGDVNDLGVVSIDVKNQLETWAVVGRDQNLQMAFVDGDSLVGQGFLNVAAINIASGVPVVQKQIRRPYPDIHLGEPVWLQRIAQDEVLLPKWLDGEATVERLQVEGSLSSIELASKGNYSVLPKGSFVTKAFHHETANDSYFVNRIRNGDKWQYTLCEM
jgi:hypothetical protein